MQLQECTVSELVKLVVWDSYVGGSHQGSLERYLDGKTLRRTGERALDVFGWGAWARVRNVEFTEDKLLATPWRTSRQRPTWWNRHWLSSCYQDAGYVYVLRRSRPMTAAGKWIVGGTGVAIVGGLSYLAYETWFKPKPLVAQQPPPQPPPSM